MKNIFIGPSVRSGGSLINRLFDGHHSVASYPFELYLPMDTSLHSVMKERGQNKNIQNYPLINGNDSNEIILKKLLLSEKPNECLVGSRFVEGVLKGKATGLNVESNFDHARFISIFLDSVGKERSIGSIYNKLHSSFFGCWDNGKYSGTMEYVAYHSGNGLMADIEKYLHEFQDSYFIQPIRDVRGYLSSEKKKVIRQLMGRGFIGRHVDLPDWVLKRYYGRFFETTLVNWLVTLTRSVILKERIGDKYIVYRHEDLVNDTESIMNSIANSIGLEFNDTLLTPTVAHVDWQGNSMYGKQTGINPNLAKVRDVFNSVEVELINKYCGKIIDYMSNLDIGLVDYSGLDRSILLDYDMQQQYYDDRNKTALYFSSMYERWAYRSVLSDTVSSFKMKPKTYFLDL